MAKILYGAKMGGRGCKIELFLEQSCFSSTLAQWGGVKFQPGQIRNRIVLQWFAPVQMGCPGLDASGFEFWEFSVFWPV